LKALHAHGENSALAFKYGLDETLLKPNLRQKELENWLKFSVRPHKSALMRV
jgi:hypothetical protein